MAEDVVKDTRTEMAAVSAKGDIIALDFHSKAFIKGESSNAIKKGLNGFKKMGEPLIYGIDMSEEAGRRRRCCPCEYPIRRRVW